MSREDDRNGNIIIGLAVTLLVGFIGLAIKRGKWKELLLTSSVLIFTWYLMSFIENLDRAFYWIPFINYAIYWVYILCFKKEQKIYDSCEHWQDTDWWWSLNGWEFEEEVAKIFNKNGYKATVTKKTGDGGVDIIMYRDKKKILVQCKHYKNTIPVSYLRELNGLKEDFKADELIMVASSGISKDGYEFIENKPYYSILDLEDIMKLGLD